MKKQTLTRRAFLAATTTSTVLPACATRVNTARVVPGRVSPNERLNIAAIGAGGMGRANIDACSTENIVALCDVDDKHAADTFRTYPKASRYRDFRVTFDKEHKNIDAVIVATPDHTHAVAAMAAMRAGKHLYCQKPLAHSIYEVRRLTETARQTGVQTQMGNQGHSSEQIRRLREWVQAGAIGQVREVHAWSDRPVGGNPWSDFPIIKRPEERPPVPDTLAWDLWLGPAKERPYHPIYCPMTWRGFWDFGTGALGDMGCHILDPIFYALELTHATSVEASFSTFVREGLNWDKEFNTESYPRASILHYRFPARGNYPPLKLTWYDGGLMPERPLELEQGLRMGNECGGALFIGDEGKLICGAHGAAGLRILPESKMQAYERPPKHLPRSIGHHEEFIAACKGGPKPGSNFDYAAPLTVTVLLGNVAMRAQQRIDWDPVEMKVTNVPEANAYLQREYRQGWEL